jgi:S-adenosylmethionine hydrolase
VDYSKNPATSLVVMTDYDFLNIARFKGILKKIAPQTDVTDVISCSGNLETDAYILDQVAYDYPPNTFFIYTKMSDLSSSDCIYLQTDDEKNYLAPNNGVLTYVAQHEGVNHIFKIANSKLYLSLVPSTIFFGIEGMLPVAAQLMCGLQPEEVGPIEHKINTIPIKQATVIGSKIITEIVYIDSEGNVVTDATADQLKSLKQGQLVKINFQGRVFPTPYLGGQTELFQNRLFARVDRRGVLEIIIPGKNAADYLKVKRGDRLTITF